MFDPDIVTRNAPVDPALQRCFRHDQSFRLGEEGANFFRQQKRFSAAIEDVARIVAQQAEIGTFDRIRLLWQDIAIRTGLEIIAAHAEEDEALIAEPFQEFNCFFLVARRDVRIAVQALNFGGHTGAHFLIVRGCGMDIIEGGFGFSEELRNLALAQVRKVDLD